MMAEREIELVADGKVLTVVLAVGWPTQHLFCFWGRKVDRMFEEIWREYETSKGLAWLVRALMLIGGESTNPPQRVASLGTLQSMLSERGHNEELIEALEIVKRSLPGHAEYVAEIDAMTPPHIRALQNRLSSPELTETERESVMREAASLLVGGSVMSPQALAEALNQLADPLLPEEAQRVVRDGLTRMLIEKMERKAD